MGHQLWGFITRSESTKLFNVLVHSRPPNFTVEPMFHFDYTQVPFVCKLHHPVTQERGNHDLCAPEAKAHHTHIIHPWPVHTKEIYTGRSSLSSHISSPGSYLRSTFY